MTVTIGATAEESPVRENLRVVFFDTDHVRMFCFINCQGQGGKSSKTADPSSRSSKTSYPSWWDHGVQRMKHVQ
jgi:hypothetical protein